MAIIKFRERAHPRRKIYMSCEVACEDRLVSGKVIDASYGGIGILFPHGADLIKENAHVHIPPLRETPVQSPEEIILRAQLAYRKEMTKGHHAGFRIEQIENGQPVWNRLCGSLTRNE
jgi:PilZ domain-containing protein